MSATYPVPHSFPGQGCLPPSHPIPSRAFPFFKPQPSLPEGKRRLERLSGLIHQRGGGAGGGVSGRPSPRGSQRPSPHALIAVAARPTPPARVRGPARAPHGPDGGDPGFRGRKAPLSSSLAVREREEGEAGCCPARPLSLRYSASSRQEVKVPGGVRMAQLSCAC